MSLTPNGYFDYVVGPPGEVVSPIQAFQDQVDAALALLAAAAGSTLFLAVDLVNSTTVFANITDLTANVFAGRKYLFRATLFIDDSAAEGVKFDLAGGTATATNLRATYLGWDNALSLIAHVTALATVASVENFSGVGKIEINGAFEPSADGTFIVRAAQKTHTSGSLTIMRGSSLVVSEAP